ncbi:hypothetical protein OHA21_21180 [Actinoplanes sp. NBC_00393]
MIPRSITARPLAENVPPVMMLLPPAGVDFEEIILRPTGGR